MVESVLSFLFLSFDGFLFVSLFSLVRRIMDNGEKGILGIPHYNRVSWFGGRKGVYRRKM